MGKVIKVSGPLVVADGMADANMADVVRVGPKQLIGEILNMTGRPFRSMRRPPVWGRVRRWSPPALPCPWSWGRG